MAITARRSDGRTPVAVLCAALVLVFPATSVAGESEDAATWKARFGPLGQLAGRCWTGKFADSDARDLRCWEWALQERFLRETHRVVGAGEAYSGETYYGWDAAAGSVRFWYFNSLGGVRTGTMTEVEGRLYSMAIDGSDVRRLTDHLADDGYPSWSPDGRWIAFDSDRHGDIDVFVMRPDGSDVTRLTEAEGSEQAPLWVPRQRSE